MKIAFVVQRFGPGVEGGAERHCAMVASRLATTDEVEVLTSTALQAGRWDRSHFAEGIDRHEGLAVRRFAVDARRGPFGLRYAWLQRRIRSERRSLSDEAAWLEAQGPTCPGLMRWLEAERERYDAVVFFTYLYPTTASGILHVADRAVLVPTAHDEPALRLDAFRPLFLVPRVILYNTVEEQALVQARFHNAHVRSAVAGVGIDEPPPAAPDPEPPSDDVVFVGRVDQDKIVDLIPWFLRWADDRKAAARLVLLGKHYTSLPSDPRILAPGFVSEAEKWRWLRRARVFVMPSEKESLSMVLLEAWSVGAPALVNGKSPVLAGHVARSGGGQVYTSFETFSRGLDVLLGDRAAAAAQGEAGRAYVGERYTWERVMPVIRDAVAFAATR